MRKGGLAGKPPMGKSCFIRGVEVFINRHRDDKPWAITGGNYECVENSGENPVFTGEGCESQK